MSAINRSTTSGTSILPWFILLRTKKLRFGGPNLY
uniref:Uncharacterized protein n=1 Tax=Setaria italica TaxID=4555 RepID=K3YEZ4_SETIT